MQTMTEPLRLNLGCRKTRIPGYKNFDIRKEQDVDYVGDAADLSRFETGSVESIHASNIFEHFLLTKNQAVLTEWCRVIKPGGKLYISVPDWDFCVEHYLKTGILSRWLQYHLWGEHHHEFAFHYTAFNYPMLRRMLDEAGFSRARRIKDMPFGLDDASALRDSWFLQPIALNCEATK